MPEDKEKFEILVSLYKETHRDIPFCKRALTEADWDYDKAKKLLETDPGYSWIREALEKGCYV